jgi:CheY-like chemotaxis protein
MREGTRILVAEDNPALALVVRFHLEQAGFSVTVARTGKEAWDLLQRQPFDMLLTDQQMPEMSGSEVCREMQAIERLAGIPVIMLTAKGLEIELGWMREQYGVREVMPKPFSLRQLVDTVESCLSSAAPVEG